MAPMRPAPIGEATNETSLRAGEQMGLDLTTPAPRLLAPCRGRAPAPRRTLTTIALDRLIASTETTLAEVASSRLPESYLVAARRTLMSAREAPDNGVRAQRLAPLAQQISDSWPNDSTLGVEILTYAQGLRTS